MQSRSGRIAALALATMVAFGVTLVILLKLVPEPRKEIDYLVIGTLATFAALAVLFVVLVTRWVKDPAVFFKRRRGDG